MRKAWLLTGGCCNCINRPSMLSYRHAAMDASAYFIPARSRALAFGLPDRGAGNIYFIGNSFGKRGHQQRHASPCSCLWHAFMHSRNIPSHKKSTARPYKRRPACRPVWGLHGARTVFHTVPHLPVWGYCCQLSGGSCRHGAGSTAALSVGSTSATTRIDLFLKTTKSLRLFNPLFM